MSSPEGDTPILYYPGFDCLPELPGFPALEIDDDIVLKNSDAYTGVRIKDGNQAREFELFRWPADHADETQGEIIEFYPLDGSDVPFEFLLQGCGIVGEEETTLAAIAKLAFYQRAQAESQPQLDLF